MMKDKPQFYSGQHVYVYVHGAPGGAPLYCAITGKAPEHIIDTWIVKSLTKPDQDWLISQGYPYSCFIVPGSLISLDYYPENENE